MVADRLTEHELAPWLGGVVSFTPLQGFNACLDDWFRTCQSPARRSQVEITSFIVAAISKNLRMPDGFKVATFSDNLIAMHSPFFIQLINYYQFAQELSPRLNLPIKPFTTTS